MKSSYLETSVPVERSKEQIRKLLIEEGMTSIAWSEDVTRRREIVRFAKPIQDPNTNSILGYHTIMFDVQVPEAQGRDTSHRRWTSTGYRVIGRTLQEKQEQLRRASFRAMFNILKAEFDSIRFGVRTFEQAFLAHMVFKNGTTGALRTGLEMMQDYLSLPALPAGTPASDTEGEYREVKDE